MNKLTAEQLNQLYRQRIERMVQQNNFTNGIAIITDSGCDLSVQQTEENGILVVPLQVTVDGDTYRDGVEIAAEEVVQLLKEQCPVTTSMPLPGDVTMLFSLLKEYGILKAVAVTISSGLSGTWDMMRLIAHDAPIDVEVVDTRHLCMAQGYMVLDMAMLRAKNLPIGEYGKHLQASRDNTLGYFVLGSLDYLIRGGRIGLVTAAVGKLLVLKPIISINEEGKTHTMANALGLKRAASQMVAIARNFTAGYRFEATLLYADGREACEAVAEKLREMSGQISVAVRQLGPTLCAHAGPEILAICLRRVAPHS